MPVTKVPLQSEFGFKSPNFSVDAEGNVFVKSLTYTTDQGTTIDADYLVTSDDKNLVFSGFETTNPTITLNKGTTYTFGLSLLDTEGLPLNEGFYILSSVNVPYTPGVKHFDADGVQTSGGVFNRTDGIISFQVPFDAPAILYYSIGSTDLKGQFNIAEPEVLPVGAFANLIVSSSLTVTANDAIVTLSPSEDGVVNIAPNGGGSLSNMSVAATILNASKTVSLAPDTELTINPLVLGEINNTNIGQSIPAAGAFTVLTASGGSINNVTIGQTTPAAAAFTEATVETVENDQDVTNKSYVDSTASALAIALGT